MAVSSVKKPPPPPAPKPPAPENSDGKEKVPVGPATPADSKAVTLSTSPPAPSPTTQAAPSDGRPVPPPSATRPITAEDNARINTLYGELIGYQDNLSSVTRSKAAAIVGKDFKNISAGANEREFVGQVSDFLTDITEDGARMKDLGKDTDTYIRSIHIDKLRIADIQKTGGYTDEQMTAAVNPTAKGLLRASIEELANSTATFARAAQTYGKRLDAKAGELNSAWDASLHNEKTAGIVQGILTVTLLFGNLGIGANAIAQTVGKDVEAALKKVDVEDIVGQQNAILAGFNLGGLRTGQVFNLFGAITNVDLLAYRTSSATGEAEIIKGIDTEGMTKLKGLSERFQKYVDEYNTPPPDNGGWFIPGV